jgi:hypothetical protein
MGKGLLLFSLSCGKGEEGTKIMDAIDNRNLGSIRGKKLSHHRSIQI